MTPNRKGVVLVTTSIAVWAMSAGGIFAVVQGAMAVAIVLAAAVTVVSAFGLDLFYKDSSVEVRETWPNR